MARPPVLGCRILSSYGPEWITYQPGERVDSILSKCQIEAHPAFGKLRASVKIYHEGSCSLGLPAIPRS